MDGLPEHAARPTATGPITVTGHITVGGVLSRAPEGSVTFHGRRSDALSPPEEGGGVKGAGAAGSEAPACSSDSWPLPRPQFSLPVLLLAQTEPFPGNELVTNSLCPRD